MKRAWRIRAGKPADASLFTSFRCADPAVSWSAEVERFIQNDLIAWAFDPRAQENDPRVLLTFDVASKSLVGLAAHERCAMATDDGAVFSATKLEVVAVAKSWQGRTFPTGERVSDVVMSGVMKDVCDRVPARDARIFAVVHEDNVRSIALCKKHGLTEELSRPERGPSYRRLVTAHRG